jgi:hypothetical protein
MLSIASARLDEQGLDYATGLLKYGLPRIRIAHDTAICSLRPYINLMSLHLNRFWLTWEPKAMLIVHRTQKRRQRITSTGIAARYLKRRCNFHHVCSILKFDSGDLMTLDVRSGICGTMKRRYERTGMTSRFKMTCQKLDDINPLG